jgi:hypothetical protein
MSADNYYLVRVHPETRRFVPLMGFASDFGRPYVRADRDEPSFDTPELALASVLNDYAEYGHSIDPECYQLPDEFTRNVERREELAQHFTYLMEDLLEELPLADVADILARSAEDWSADND